MLNVLKTKILACLGLALLSAASFASFIDASILIERAANNRTLSVRYDGANAAVVEMLVNGKSVASRQVNADQSTGETNFTVDTAALQDGANTVEIRLFDPKGKLLGSEKTTIQVDRQGTGPVTISTPKANETVQGVVEIKLGFKQELKNVYVSFFVDDEFKILKNFPPYNYRWDTTGVSNGWHEVQAWIIDENNATFKTDKLRLFVDNPGGKTNRPDETVKPVAGNTVPPTSTEKPVKPTTDLKAPTTATVKGGASAKSSGGSGTATGPRLMNPASPDKPIKVGATKPGTAETVDPGIVAISTTEKPVVKLEPLKIGFGTRLADRDHMDIYLEGAKVTFDVSPRITEGVPLAPFRHLFEADGGKVKWDHNSKRVDGTSDSMTLSFSVGNPNATVNGRSMFMETAPFIEHGRTIVPLSFMGEALGYSISFDQNSGHVLILSAKSR